MSAGKILVVEDEVKLVQLLRRVLTATHFDIVTTGRGENAIEMAALEQPDLVLLDLVLASTMDGYTVARRIREFSDVPIIFISVLEKQRIFKSIEAALQVYENRRRRVPTSQLNEVMQKAINAYHPPVVRGNAIKIKYVTQLPTNTPTFAFFCNYPDDLKTPYKNYLENQLRENFDFSGVPVRLFFRKK